jgi:hypothetical protein
MVRETWREKKNLLRVLQGSAMARIERKKGS